MMMGNLYKLSYYTLRFKKLNSAWRSCFYFDDVQPASSWRGQVTQMIASMVHKENKTTLRKARQIQSGLNHDGYDINHITCIKIIFII